MFPGALQHFTRKQFPKLTREPHGKNDAWELCDKQARACRGLVTTHPDRPADFPGYNRSATTAALASLLNPVRLIVTVAILARPYGNRLCVDKMTESLGHFGELFDRSELFHTAQVSH